MKYIRKDFVEATLPDKKFNISLKNTLFLDIILYSMNLQMPTRRLN